MSLYYLLLLLLIFSFPFYSIYALTNNGKKELLKPIIQNEPSTKLLSTIYTKSFLSNTEYFNKISEGETIFGFHLIPSLSLLITESIGLDIGLIWRKNFGQIQPWHNISPSFSTFYKEGNNIFVIGIFNLQQYQPTFVAPLLDPNRLLRKPFMEGFHFKKWGNKSYIAGWVDWLTLCSKQNKSPETFTAHLDLTYHCSNLQDCNRIEIPFQLTIYHLGGQGISVKDFSLFCGASGCTLSFTTSNCFFQRINCSSYLLFNRYIKQIDRPSKKGWGQLHAIDLTIPLMEISVNYWYGSNFSSENIGSPLYQSIRIENNKVLYHESIRNLLFLSIYKNWAPRPNISIGVTCRPYYDFNNHLLEYGLYFNFSYSNHFPLGKI